MIYKPDYFRIEEFVSLHTYQERGDRAWELLDPRITATWDELRKRTGRSCMINTWLSGGKFSYRGFRPFSYYEDGVDHYSQHCFGRACDGDVYGMTSEEVIHYIVSEKSKGSFHYLTGIELGVSWVHLDVRPSLRCGKNGLFFFSVNGEEDWETYVWPL